MRVAGDPDLKIYGIFGFPLAHTISPAIQNAAIDFHGLKAFYFAFERSPERFRYLMRRLKTLLLDGFNVTVPYKEMVIPFLDRVHPTAKAIGAVNTVKKEGRKWVGYNTDYEGFLAGFRLARFAPRGKCTVLAGAGGAARAVCFALAKSKVKQISIFDKVPGKAKKLAAYYGKLFPSVQWRVPEFTNENLKTALQKADLLIQATPVGLHAGDPLIVTKSMFPKRKILIYDLIYRPRLTKLLKLAKRLGHKVLNGETMLLEQGARAFEIWTDKKAPVSVMRRAMNDVLRAR